MTAVAYLDLHIENSESFDAEVIISNINSNLAITVSDFEFIGEIRKHHYSKNASARFIPTPTPLGKSVFISLSYEQTKALRPGKYIYDVFLRDKRELRNKYSTKFEANSSIVKSITLDAPNFLTIDFWIYPISSGKIFTIKNDLDVVMELNYGTNAITGTGTVSDMMSNTWNHIAINYKNEKLTFYKNNIEIETIYNPITYLNNIILGDDTNSFIGNISNFKISSNFTNKFNLKVPAISDNNTLLFICNNQNIINTYQAKANNVVSSELSPFDYKIYFYKIIEGNVIVYHTATKI